MRRRQYWRRPLHDRKPLLDQVGVIELATADKRRCMMSPSAHRPGIVQPKRPGDKPFATIGTGHDAIGTESAAGSARYRQGAQLVIIHQGIGKTLSTRVDADISEVMVTTGDPNEHALWR